MTMKTIYAPLADSPSYNRILHLPTTEYCICSRRMDVRLQSWWTGAWLPRSCT